MNVAEQLEKLQNAKRAISGTIVTPRRQDPYLEIEHLSLEGTLYWRPDRMMYELITEEGSEMYRTPEMLLREFRVRGRRAVSD